MKKRNSQVLNMLVLIGQVGITMLVPIIVCTLVFAWLGERCGVKWLAVIGFIIGAISGFQSTYRILKTYLNSKDK